MSNPAQAVLEELLRFAMEEALTLRAQQTRTEEEAGALMAYLNLLEMGKEQASVAGIKFDDFELNEFDLYSLIDKEEAS